MRYSGFGTYGSPKVCGGDLSYMQSFKCSKGRPSDRSFGNFIEFGTFLTVHFWRTWDIGAVAEGALRKRE